MAVRKRVWTTGKGEEKTAWMVDYGDANGVRRQKTFAKKKDADAYFAKVKVDISEGTHVADRATVTVADAGDDWIKSCKASGLERTTTDGYENHLELHLKPYLGRTLLSKLTVPAIRNLQDKLREEGRSPAMVKRVTVSLGSIIADAQERGLVARNVVREMAQRRGKGRDRHVEKRQKARLRVGVDIPTPGEVGLIIKAAEGRYRPLLLTAIFAGLRASELRGLRWDDVDLQKNVLHVRQRADRYHEIGMPKSDAGQRTIPLPPIVVNTLREWKLACPKGDLGLAFPNGEGNVEWHANIIKRGLIPTQIAAGVTIDSGKKDKDGEPILIAKYPGLHALRHFYASWCINRVEDGGLALPPKVVQERMGHSSITMTMDVYGHLFPSADDSDALAEAERRLLSAVNAT
jgi:integrase